MARLNTLLWSIREALVLVISCFVLGQLSRYLPEIARGPSATAMMVSQYLLAPFLAGWLVVVRKWGGIWHSLLGGSVIAAANGSIYGLIGSLLLEHRTG